MKNKKGFELSFGWLFSIIVGIAFISAAIYISTKVLDTSRDFQSAEDAKQIGVLLNPLETGIESSKSGVITFSTNTRTYFSCDNIGYFGNQGIGISSESSVGEEWRRPSVMSKFKGKYIFSGNYVEGEKMAVFVKPFYMPYKIADVMYAFSENEVFCFVDSPNYVEKDFSSLGIKGINISSNGECPRNSTTVCFSKTGCDIDVNPELRTVRKYKKTIYYAEDDNYALLYAAIFSEPGMYECQLKRLMKRNAALADIYLSKALSLSSRGCNSNLESEMVMYSNSTSKFNNTIEIRNVKDMSDEIKRRNDALNCKLF